MSFGRSVPPSVIFLCHLEATYTVCGLDLHNGLTREATGVLGNSPFHHSIMRDIQFQRIVSNGRSRRVSRSQTHRSSWMARGVGWRIWKKLLILKMEVGRSDARRWSLIRRHRRRRHSQGRSQRRKRGLLRRHRFR